MSFISELKRRNVFKVGIAYVVGGWLILQLAEVLSELLDLPDVVGRTIVAVVAIGFPIALFFAWAYELTPEGVKREKDVNRETSITANTGKKLNTAILVMMAVAIVYLLYDKFAGEEPAPVSTSAVDTAEVNTQPEAESAPDPLDSDPSIAVLPFDNRSNLEEDEFFVEGVHDDLLTSLARIGSLKVISRTSVNQYKDTTKTIPQIARELGVTSVMEGAVQRSGDKIRINVQLIDADTDEHLWAQIYDRELTADNLFDIQTEISKAIAEALHATLSPAESEQLERKPTDNLAAYNAFLRGRQAQSRRTAESLATAMDEFNRAIELDPEYAMAWVGLAESTNLAGLYGNLGVEERWNGVERAVNRALEIDPLLGEAYASLGILEDSRGNFEDAEAAFLKAIDLSPNYPTAYHWYAVLLTAKPDRVREALRLDEKALELDPLSSIIRSDYGEVATVAGEFELAERILTDAYELDPQFVPGLSSLAYLEWEQGRIDEGLRWTLRGMKLDPDSMLLYISAHHSLSDLGLFEQAEVFAMKARELQPEHRFPIFMDIFRNTLQGRQQPALELLRQVSRRDATPWESLGTAVWFANLREWDSARDHLVKGNPGYYDPEAWENLISLHQDFSCKAALIMARTGEPELAEALMTRTRDYMTDVLANAIEHPDRWWPSLCHAPLGENEAALASLRTKVDHGHLAQWSEEIIWPGYDGLRDDPEFQAIVAEANRKRAVMAENALAILADEGRP